jgi:hypothetical protein
MHQLRLTAANCTVTFPAAGAGKSFILSLLQDTTGGRLVTWPASAKWSGGIAPTLTTTAQKQDILTFVCIDGVNWLGFFAAANF